MKPVEGVFTRRVKNGVPSDLGMYARDTPDPGDVRHPNVCRCVTRGGVCRRAGCVTPEMGWGEMQGGDSMGVHVCMRQLHVRYLGDA